ncbi:MAG: hypothetical protein HY907_19240 [Deltaproteobacteria bacterium]|nr:hypothetical protein [Deltaproteobacteria bacterium]
MPATFVAFRARFESVRDFGQRVELLSGVVREATTEELLAFLGDATRATVARDHVAIEALLAWIVMSVTSGSPLGGRERELFRQAERGGDPLLVTLLQPPFPLVPDEAPAGRVLNAEDGRPLTLGERRAAARRGDRFLLDRLLADPDPGVTARLLLNPMFTEREAIRVAAWRPGRADVLLEVLRCPRWAVRPAVQSALLRNPAMPVAVATRLTLLLPLPKLREVLKDMETPLLVRLACERHLELLGKRRKARVSSTHSPG